MVQMPYIVKLSHFCSKMYEYSAQVFRDNYGPEYITSCEWLLSIPLYRYSPPNDRHPMSCHYKTL